MMASDPIPALMLATPCPDCGAAIGQPCRITNPPPAPPGVGPRQPERLVRWQALGRP
jgi:hypothetical protein